MVMKRYNWLLINFLFQNQANRATMIHTVGDSSSVSTETELTGWTIRASNPGGGGAKFAAPVQNGLGAHPASCTVGTGSFAG